MMLYEREIDLIQEELLLDAEHECLTLSTVKCHKFQGEMAQLLLLLSVMYGRQQST